MRAVRQRLSRPHSQAVAELGDHECEADAGETEAHGEPSRIRTTRDYSSDECDGMTTRQGTLTLSRRKRRRRRTNLTPVVVKVGSLSAVILVVFWSIKRERHRFGLRHGMISDSLLQLPLEAKELVLSMFTVNSAKQDNRHIPPQAYLSSTGIQQPRQPVTKILTIYAESPDTLDTKTLPLMRSRRLHFQTSRAARSITFLSTSSPVTIHSCHGVRTSWQRCCC